MVPPLRIAFLSEFDPADRHACSGGNASMFSALARHVNEIVVLDSGWGGLDVIDRYLNSMSSDVQLRLRWRLRLLLAPILSRHIERQLVHCGCNVLFATYGFQYLFRVDVPRGMISAYTSDATPTIYKRSPVGQSFGSHVRLSRLFDSLITAFERNTFRNTDLLLWSSQWLHEEAVALYGLSARQSQVVDWGANIDAPEPEAHPPRIAPDAPLHLLFVGRDWSAKGGPMAVAVLRQLRLRGIDARLTVVGTQPPLSDLDSAMMIHRYLDKTDPQQLKQFVDLMRSSHFMMMMSLESYGFAYCEASAYGLPSLALRVAGVPVRDGVNGHSFPIGTDVDAIVNCILGYVADPKAYAAMRQKSRKEYEDRLNWDVWAQRTTDLLRSRLSESTQHK